ncbi:iron complex outermembrane recepter protein [Catalinimonas alkaloidigena]|uniref:Iron complex outermembrane recepter protein n=1 Tax=Catalinimonas alkaloidigena TaxID=1075417 RepID=A0A1G9VDP0_9BACT|nr:TonB-dependent receptor [Catalinimonas alkaloidigena]SDM70388.1 iron complex outermembrane recepter protein [Catalinimonas alkaloidigena]
MWGWALVFILVSGSAWAQGTRCTLSGQVVDRTQAGLPGATVVVVALEGATSSRGTATDAQGQFVLARLRPGAYEVTVRHIGYQTRTDTVQLRQPYQKWEVRLDPVTQELAGVTITQTDQTPDPIPSLPTLVIDQAFLRRYQAAGNFAEALEKLPGLSAITTGTGIGKPVIRGMSFNRIQVNDKGIAQQGQQWGADHGLEIDPYDLERVAIVKGPGALRYGSDAMGGVIALQPPEFPPVGEGQAELYQVYKGNNSLWGTSGVVRGQTSRHTYRLRLSTQDYADYRVPASTFTYNRYVLPIEGERLKNSAGQERNVAGSWGWRNDHWQLQVHGSHFAQRVGLFTGSHGIPRAYQLAHDGNYRNQDLPRQVNHHDKLLVNATWLRPGGWWELDLGYQRNDRREESLPHAHGYYGPLPEDNLGLGLVLQTGTAHLRWHHSLGAQHQQVWGLSFQQQRNRRSGFEFLLPDYTSGSTGLFGIHTWQPHPAWTWEGGVRVDGARHQIAAYREPVYDTTGTWQFDRQRNPSIDRSFGNLSGALGVRWEPRESLRVKVHAGTSFRMPTPVELSANGMHHGTMRHEVGDADLRSERGWQGDLAVEWTPRPSFFLSLSPFFSYYDNYLYLRPSVQYALRLPPSEFFPEGEWFSLAEAGQIYRYVQARAVYTGGEWQVRYQPLRGVTLLTAVEYVWNQNLNEATPLPFTPPFSCLQEAEWSLLQDRKRVQNLFVRVSYHQFAAQRRVDRNEPATPGYALVETAAGITLAFDAWSCTLEWQVRNLLDERYMNHLSRYRLLNLPEPGRNHVVSLRVPLRWKTSVRDQPN